MRRVVLDDEDKAETGVAHVKRVVWLPCCVNVLVDVLVPIIDYGQLLGVVELDLLGYTRKLLVGNAHAGGCVGDWDRDAPYPTLRRQMQLRRLRRVRVHLYCSAMLKLVPIVAYAEQEGAELRWYSENQTTYR